MIRLILQNPILCQKQYVKLQVHGLKYLIMLLSIKKTRLPYRVVTRNTIGIFIKMSQHLANISFRSLSATCISRLLINVSHTYFSWYLLFFFYHMPTYWMSSDSCQDLHLYAMILYVRLVSSRTIILIKIHQQKTQLT